MMNHMHDLLTRIVLLLVVICAMRVAPAQQPGRDRILRIDAVELIDRGKEVEGKLDFQHQHGKYNYLFSTAENRKQFEAHPEKYEIQLGGACGRMGPLSGEGSPKLFGVHDGRLYIFASEKCRQAFAASPETFLERDDPKPKVTEESHRQGKTIVENVAAHSGMLRTARRLVTARERLKRTEESGGASYSVTDTVTLMLPDRVRQDSCWNDSCWGYVVSGAECWSVDSGGAEMVVEAQRQAVLRDAGRHPWYLVAHSDEPGFIATHEGKRRVLKFDGEGDIDCALVVVHWANTTTTMGVDGAGRVRVLTYRGRGSNATIGEIEKIYSEFRDVGGYEMPGRVQVTFNGKPEPTLSGAYVDQAVNDPADKSKFDVPTAKAE